MQTTSLFWHDYETFGTDPQWDRPVQFAGLRTDLEFNVIEEPVMFYCRLSDDYLPNPEACLITGITPDEANHKGVNEAEFSRLICAQLSQPQTCTLGYNNIRFDDEVTRNLLYRNFIDPYAREWQHGNSRWDLIDLVRTTRALRPEGINWPDRDDGSPSFRLEELTAANGLLHEAAHDALSDVYATVSLAKLIQQVQPKLYNYLFKQRSKSSISTLLKLGSGTPVVHVSGMYPAHRGCLAVVLPLCKHPVNANGVLVYDLSVDPEPLLTLPVDELHKRLFTAAEDLPEGVERIPLKTVHINKCPVVAPLSVLREADQERLAIDLQRCLQNKEKILTANDLQDKISDLLTMQSFAEQQDPDLMIYSGGFFSQADKQKIESVRAAADDQLVNLNPHFSDSRLPEMLFRYRARNFPETLTAKEKLRWENFCRDRIVNNDRGINLQGYLAEIARMQSLPNVNESLCHALHDYALKLSAKLDINKPSSLNV